MAAATRVLPLVVVVVVAVTRSGTACAEGRPGQVHVDPVCWPWAAAWPTLGHWWRYAYSDTCTSISGPRSLATAITQTTAVPVARVP